MRRAVRAVRARGGGRAWGRGDGGEGEAWSQWRRVDRVTFRIPRHARQGGPPGHYFGLRASRSGIGLSEERASVHAPRAARQTRVRAGGLPEVQVLLRFLTLPEKAFCRERR